MSSFKASSLVNTRAFPLPLLFTLTFGITSPFNSDISSLVDDKLEEREVDEPSSDQKIS